MAGRWRAGGEQVCALPLEGKTDQEKFKELGWGLVKCFCYYLTGVRRK
jgi:hypothetical protein